MSDRLEPSSGEMTVDRALWPAERINDLLTALARHGNLESRPADLSAPPALTDDTCGPWIEASARTMGLEAECADVAYAQMEDWLRRASVAIVRIRWHGKLRFAAILGRNCLLTPNLRTVRVSPATLASVILRPLEEEPGVLVDQLLDRMGLAAGRVAARRAVLAEQLAERAVTCWTLGLPAGARARALWKAHGLSSWLVGFVLAHSSYLLLWVGAWWLAGAGILQGRLDRGWLIAWALLLATLVPLRMAAVWLQGRLSIAAGILLRERLLQGTLQLDPDAISGEGAGQLLGRVLESDAFESLALGGGFTAAAGLLELAAAAILLIGTFPSAIVALAAWCGLAGWTAVRCFVRTERWTATRLRMTNALVERMVGHRTRLAQETPEQWHVREDEDLDRYLDNSVHRDRAEAALHAVVPQGWLIVGLLSIGPVFLSARPGGAALAAGLGAVLLAYRGFRHATSAISQLADARAAWLRLRPLLSAAAHQVRYAPPHLSVIAEVERHEPIPVLDVQGLSYRYPSRSEAILRRCSLQVVRGDRVLLEGLSGCGKSTLVALLVGLRPPQAGSLLAGGLDRSTLGVDGWRRRIVAAPQAHQNHIITGTLGFNLLMGRSRSPTKADEDEALAICREMGLGDLLARMPGGLHQMVGETGWQLSQGERGRVFMARALLQRADLVVLDESFAALDAETLNRTLACVLERAPSVLIVAHHYAHFRT